jgi:hypothetical protein
MVHAVTILAVLAIGFGLGRVHKAAQLKSKILALETLVTGDAKAAYAKVRSIL